MHKRTRGARSVALAALMGLGLLLFCALTGLMVAVMPPGVLVRLLIAPLALFALVLLWVVPKRATTPDGLHNLLLATLIVLINIWPAYIVHRFGGLPYINPTKLAWLALLGVVGVNLFSSKPAMARLVARCKAHPLLIGGVVFLFGWRVVSAASGVQPVAQVVSMASEVIGCYAIFFIALAVLRDERDVFRLLKVLVAVAMVQALLASYESVVKHTLFDKFVVLSSEDAATMVDTLREKFRNGHYRAQGTFEHPMVLAEFMAMSAPLALVLFLSRQTSGWRWTAAAFLPVALVVIVSSRSRVGIAVLLAAVLLVGGLMLLPRGRRQGSSLSLVLTMFLLPVLMVGAYFALNEMISLAAGRSVSEANSSLARVLMMERGIPLLKASPLVGYGYGMGAVKLGFFDGARFNIDNYLLGVALDSGLPGLFAFVGVFIGATFMGVQCYRRRDDRGGLAAGFIAVSIVVLLGCKTVLSIASGFTLGYILIAAIIVLLEPAAGAAEPAAARAVAA
ncbi:O-antigen ligase family protein [Rugamonas sp. A1-17]|nr:O-antigen ligase family protein [Rugamonas sp. A1-17]